MKWNLALDFSQTFRGTSLVPFNFIWPLLRMLDLNWRACHLYLVYAARKYSYENGLFARNNIVKYEYISQYWNIL